MNSINEMSEDHIFALIKTRNPHGHRLISDLIGLSWSTGACYPKQFHYYDLHTDEFGSPEMMNQLSMGYHTVKHPDEFPKLDICSVIDQCINSSMPVDVIYFRYHELTQSTKELIAKFNTHLGLRPVWVTPELNKPIGVSPMPNYPERDSNGNLKFK